MASSIGSHLNARPRIAIDAMGGDNAPGEIVAGALLANADGVGRMILVGDEAKIAPLLHGTGAEGIEIHHTIGEVAMDAAASQAVRKSAGTSLGEAVELVRSNAADAIVSAGNSGAFLAIALLRLRTIPGIARPAIAVVFPTKAGPVVLCDAGANVDCRPEWLVQFGIMGSAYARIALGVEHPRVGIVSIGEERNKGNALSIEAADLLDAAPINFIGNVEGKDIFEHHADVIISDGFVGNVILKTAEGASNFFRHGVRDAIARSSPLTKFGALLMRPVFEDLAQRLSYDTYGGAPLLGVRGNCIVAHGRSNRKAIRNAIRSAAKLAENDFIGRIGAVSAA